MPHVSAAPPAKKKGTHYSVNIDEAENGFVVNVNYDGPKGEYVNKRYIATTEKDVKELVNQALAHIK